MPHSVFTGRPWPQPGERLFTDDDTAAAVALAMEERETCPSCGMLKAWCRDPANQFAFEPVEETCFVTYRLAQHRGGQGWQKKHDDTKVATQVAARFREGYEPDVEAGLELQVDELPVIADVPDGA